MLLTAVGSCTGWANPLACPTDIGTDYKAVAFVLEGNVTPNYVDARS
jgi:hypothetical protein